MAELVYILCALTSFACAVLLFRYYYHTRVRFLLWSGICFVGATLNNGLLFIDLIIGDLYDLSIWRIIPAFLGLLIMICGLLWDTLR